MWLGDELTDCALDGFVAMLSRTDLPTAEQIAQLHAERKSGNAELPMLCGAEEMVRRGLPLSRLSQPVQQAILASQWHYVEKLEDARKKNWSISSSETISLSQSYYVAYRTTFAR